MVSLPVARGTSPCLNDSDPSTTCDWVRVVVPSLAEQAPAADDSRTAVMFHGEPRTPTRRPMAQPLQSRSVMDHARGPRGLLVAAFVALTGCGKPWDDYRWTASSAAFGLPVSGTLDHRGQHDLLLHTAEEANPWLVVDMLEDRPITRVVVKNRLDCCQERGLPMVVELRAANGSYVEVARRATPFDTWEIGVVPARVRYLRVRVEQKTFLHLHAIEIE